MDLLPLVIPAIWRRFLEAFRGLDASSWAVGAGLCALLIVSLFRWPDRWRSLARTVSIVGLAWIVGLSLASAWRLSWLSDDAFISFRYARNLMEGHGLVFNPGERVEGYTNFLWTLLMAAGIALRTHPGQAAIVLGLASLGACLVLVSRIAGLLSPRRSPATISIAAVLLGGSYLFASFGTSGLETMMAAALVLLSLERAMHRAPASAGLAGVAAVLTRPDHALFYVALGAAIALDRRRRHELLRYTAPFFGIYIPYFLARWAWYGDFLPNTFYAKSGGGSYVSQGVVYILVCLLGGGLIGLLPLATAGIFHLRRHLLVRFTLLAIPLYLVYLARIGGDFMFGRLIIPIVPLLAILAEAGARRLFALRQRALAALGLTLAALAVLPLHLIPPSEKLWHIADERTFYRVTSFAPLRVDSPFSVWSDQLLRTFGDGQDFPSIATGCVGIVGYRTRAPMLDLFGLTDREVARQPLVTRGRPGHEKVASAALLLERNVVLADVDVYPSEYARFVQLPSGRVPVRLVRWVPRFVDQLRREYSSAVADLDAYLNDYEPPQDQPDRFACDLWFFDTFYFSQQPPAMRRGFLERLASRGQLDPVVVPFFDAPIDQPPTGWTAVATIDFDTDDLADWLAVGTSFREWPTRTPPPSQSSIGHRHGLLLDTYTEHEGDAATGALQSAPFELRGGIVTARVAGGRDRAKLAVMLVVDGRIIAAATGCNTEIPSRRVWDVRPYRGKQARLVVLDDSASGWGHLIVTDVVQWEASP